MTEEMERRAPYCVVCLQIFTLGPGSDPMFQLWGSSAPNCDSDQQMMHLVSDEISSFSGGDTLHMAPHSHGCLLEAVGRLFGSSLSAQLLESVTQTNHPIDSLTSWWAISSQNPQLPFPKP